MGRCKGINFLFTREQNKGLSKESIKDRYLFNVTNKNTRVFTVYTTVFIADFWRYLFSLSSHYQ